MVYCAYVAEAKGCSDGNDYNADNSEWRLDS